MGRRPPPHRMRRCRRRSRPRRRRRAGLGRIACEAASARHRRRSLPSRRRRPGVGTRGRGLRDLADDRRSCCCCTSSHDLLSGVARGAARKRIDGRALCRKRLPPRPTRRQLARARPNVAMGWRRPPRRPPLPRPPLLPRPRGRRPGSARGRGDRLAGSRPPWGDRCQGTQRGRWRCPSPGPQRALDVLAVVAAARLPPHCSPSASHLRGAVS